MIPVVREQALWLSEDEAFTLLMGLIRGAAAGAPEEDALLEKVGQLCRSFLGGKQQIPVESTPADTWVFIPAAGKECCRAA